MSSIEVKNFRLSENFSPQLKFFNPLDLRTNNQIITYQNIIKVRFQANITHYYYYNNCILYVLIIILNVNFSKIDSIDSFSQTGMLRPRF